TRPPLRTPRAPRIAGQSPSAPPPIPPADGLRLTRLAGARARYGGTLGTRMQAGREAPRSPASLDLDLAAELDHPAPGQPAIPCRVKRGIRHVDEDPLAPA